MNIRDLVGRRVTAKRTGWDVPPEGVLTGHDVLPPPEWREDGEAEDVEGELEILGGPVAVYLVGGKGADPATIRPAGKASGSER